MRLTRIQIQVLVGAVLISVLAVLAYDWDHIQHSLLHKRVVSRHSGADVSDSRWRAGGDEARRDGPYRVRRGGAPWIEAHFRSGALHGEARAWDPEGRPLGHARYENGTLIEGAWERPLLVPPPARLATQNLESVPATRVRVTLADGTPVAGVAAATKRGWPAPGGMRPGSGRFTGRDGVVWVPRQGYKPGSSILLEHGRALVGWIPTDSLGQLPAEVSAQLRPFELTGTVRRSGEPVAALVYFEVRIAPEVFRRVGRAVCDSDGRLRLPLPGAGDYQLLVQTHSSTGETVTYETLTVELGPDSPFHYDILFPAFRGELEGPGPRAEQRWQLRRCVAKSKTYKGVTDDRGGFQRGQVPPGEYLFRLAGDPAYFSPQYRLLLPRREPLLIDALPMERTVSLSRTDAPDGESWWACALFADGRRRFLGTTTMDTLTAWIPASALTLLVGNRVQGSPPRLRRLQLPAGREALRRELALAATGTLRVADPPPWLRALRLHPGSSFGRREMMQRVPVCGDETTIHLLPGSYEVLAERDAELVSLGTADITAGETAMLEIAAATGIARESGLTERCQMFVRLYGFPRVENQDRVPFVLQGYEASHRGVFDVASGPIRFHELSQGVHWLTLGPDLRGRVHTSPVWALPGRAPAGVAVNWARPRLERLVRVMDAQGQPIAGAHWHRGGGGRLHDRSDPAGGIFLFDRGKRKRPLELAIGEARSVEVPDDSWQEYERTVTVPVGRVLTVTVSGGREPIPVRLTLSLRGGRPWSAKRPPQVVHAEQNRVLRERFQDLQPAHYILSVRGPRGSLGHVELDLTEDDGTVEFELPELIPVEITVMHGQTPVNVGSVMVYRVDSDGGAARVGKGEMYADESPTVVLPGAGLYRFLYHGNKVRFRREMNVQAEGPQRITLTYDTFDVVGTLLLPDGSPAHGVFLSLSGLNGEGGYLTDRTGEFRIANLVGGEYHWRLEDSDYKKWWPPKDVFEVPGEEPVVVQLRARTASRRKPPAEAIHVTLRDPSEEPPRVFTVSCFSREAAAWLPLKRDVEGRVTLEVRSDWTLTVRGEGWTAPPIELAGVQDGCEIDLQFRVCGTLRVSVYGPEGRLKRHPVRIVPEHDLPAAWRAYLARATTSSPSVSLPVGHYRVSAELPDGRRETQQIHVQELDSLAVVFGDPPGD